MDKLIEYPKLIKDILAEYVELCDRHPNRDLETLQILQSIDILHLRRYNES